jgi:hypothetical protein
MDAAGRVYLSTTMPGQGLTPSGEPGLAPGVFVAGF